MLAQHPEIKALFGPCPRTKYIVVALVAAQILLAYLVHDLPWWAILALAYCVGAVLNHWLFLAIHEFSHNLGFHKTVHNRLFAMVANLPVGPPVAETFRYYHLLHHAHQGVDGLDVDLPTELERRLVRSRPVKLLWLTIQGLAYGLRPLFVHPKRPTWWEALNLLVQLVFCGLVVWLWGPASLVYLVLGSVLSMGLHPVAGHFISEHYVFAGEQETSSYYGPLNKVTFNVGYHNEHHDFPYIAGRRLPELRAMARGHYDELHSHRSWTKVLWDYWWREDVGAHSRVKRR